jgi:hypothetical protein
VSFRTAQTTAVAVDAVYLPDLFLAVEGKLVMGDQVNPSQRTVSEIPQTVFA